MTQLRRLIGSVVAGAWGVEPNDIEESAIRCIRAADFDYRSLRPTVESAPLRMVDARIVKRIQLSRGDLILEKSGGGARTPVGRAVLYDSDLPAICSNFAARIRPATGIDSRFLTYLLASLYSRGATESCVTQTTGIQNLDVDVWLETPVAEVSIDEQRRIADFLDDQVARIDSIVAAREKQRGLIEESRSAELNAAIETVAVDRVRLARFARVQTGVTVDAGRVLTNPIELPYLRVANVQAGGLLLDEVKTIRLEKSQVPRALLQDGDVLMTEGGDVDKLGRGTVWRSQIPGQVVHQNHVFAVRVDRHYLVPEFLTYVTAARAAREYFELTATKTTNLASTSASRVLALSVPYVDVLSQELMVSKVDAATLQWAELDRVLVDSIGKMEELKRSMITAAVTGEFDVSSADASRVPV